MRSVGKSVSEKPKPSLGNRGPGHLGHGLRFRPGGSFASAPANKHVSSNCLRDVRAAQVGVVQVCAGQLGEAYLGKFAHLGTH
jgi:hypothetical protein